MSDSNSEYRKVISTGGLFRLPLEVLISTFRADRKDIERELLLVQNFISNGKIDSAGKDPIETVDKLLRKLGMIEEQVKKDEEIQSSLIEELHQRIRLIGRLIDKDDEMEIPEWNDGDSLLVSEWLARNGYALTVKDVMKSNDKSSAKISFEADLEVAHAIREIKGSLEKGDVGPAIEWYKSHKNRIDKMHSGTEKQEASKDSSEVDLLASLHLYEITRIMEGSDDDRFVKGIEYVQKVASTGEISDANIGSMCRALSCGVRSPHKHSMDEGTLWCIQSPSSSTDQRLKAVIGTFEKYVSFVYYNEDISEGASSSSGPMLEMLVRAGIFALASPTCLSNTNVTCPCCDPLCHSWGLQPDMEHPTRLRSHFVCPYTGRIMEQASASPTGHVLSAYCLALLETTSERSERSGGIRRVRCPVTGMEYSTQDYTRIFST